MPTHVNDLGTWRRLRRVHVNDLGTWRSIKYTWINDSGTWRCVFRRDTDLTLTAGRSDFFNATGYAFTLSIGSSSVSSLDDGAAFYGLYDDNLTGSLILHIAAGSDVGQSYVSSVTINGTPFATSGAFYSYGSGSSTWTWVGFAAGFVNGGSYSVALKF